MVSWTDRCGQVVLFCPSDSLLRQMGQWLREGRVLSLHAFSRPLRRLFEQWLPEADLAVIDATSHPADAVDAAQGSLQVLGTRQTLVYTEDAHGQWRLEDGRGLETAIRELGLQFILGPLPSAQWADLLQWLCRPAATSLAGGASGATFD